MDIREGIKEAIQTCPDKKCPFEKGTWRDCIDCQVENVVTFLNDNGVGKRVEGELPDLLQHQRERMKDVPKHADTRTKFQEWLFDDCLQIIRVTKETQQKMLKAGYTLMDKI